MTMDEDINVDETTLNHVKEFTYLGRIIASDGHIEAELQKRMSQASISFGRLRERRWNNHNVPWTVYRRHVKKLHAFMMRHLPSIMKIRWQDKVTNKTGLPSMEDFLIRKNLRWTGHLLRMRTDRFRDSFSTRSYQTTNGHVAAHVSATKTQ